jgi:tRNA(Ile)-lysidine synthase
VLPSSSTSSLLRDFRPNKRYLIGVSGGRDSVALLHQLVDLGYKNLTVCHLNHQLRGRSSDADAHFVEKLVAKYDGRIAGQALRPPGSQTGKRRARPTTRIANIDLELGSKDVRTLANKKKMSMETAARETRYRFFADVAKRRHCRSIFLAHHADDLVETFLINLFRGAGTAGLASIREVSTRRIDNVDVTILRPLLGVWRNEINDYVREHRLKFREDASNKSLAPLRNRIRRRVIPYLEKTLGRNIRQSIWRAATIVAEQEDWIDNQLSDSNDVDLSVQKMRDLPIALQRRQLLNWLRKQNVASVGFDLIERVRLLLDQQSRVAKINLPQDRHARRRAGKIFVE